MDTAGVFRRPWLSIGLNNFKNLSRWFVEIAERPAVVKGFKALNKDAEIDFP